MSIEWWGLLGPATIPSQRRTRPLGLGASVRLFNEEAVPGTGGLWFAKPLLLALLGIRVAEMLRDEGKNLSNIQVANAVEALACWLAYTDNGWRSDARLRGINTLPRNIEKFTFENARSSYVTQPMRLDTVQALPVLDLVSKKNSLFNSYSCERSPLGEVFIDVATTTDSRPNKLPVLEFLTQWVRGDKQVTRRQYKLRRALSPLEPLPDGARRLLLERLIQGDEDECRRRKNILVWAEKIRQGRRRRRPTWDNRPACIDEDHWCDLQAGAHFFALQAAAYAVLEAIEKYIAGLTKPCLSLDENLPEEVENTLNILREKASICQNFGAYDDPERKEAKTFIEECLQNDSRSCARSLVKRDGKVLCLGKNVNVILPGPAFDASPQDPGNESEEVTLFPPNISIRVTRLYRLYLDLLGELTPYLYPKEGE